mgnify:CR=1 FL=1
MRAAKIGHASRFGQAMRAGRRLGLPLLVSIFAVPGAAEEADSHAFSPSLSVGFLIHVQDAEGNAQSTFPARSAFDPSVRGDPLILVPAIPVALQLAMPETEILGRTVRPFIHGRVQISMDPDRTIARQGTIPNPVLIPSDPSPTLSANSISGQGTLLTTTLDLTGQLGVGVSTALPIEVLPVRLGVSLDYLVQRVSMDGHVVHVSGTGPNEIAPFTIQNLQVLDHALFHFLGPRMELETFAGERGPFRLSIYADFGAFFALGDRSKSFSATDGSNSAAFDFEVQTWMIQAGAGLRVAWAGFR